MIPRFCQFHYGQNLSKKLRKYIGSAVYKSLRLCIAFSSLPSDSVAESFLEIKKMAGEHGKPFIKYMEHTYIKPNARYPAQYWAGVITAEGGHTTSNICESFHTHLGRLFGVGNYHPNIYLFVENLNIYHRQAQIKYFTETAVCRPEHRNTHLLNDLQRGKMGVDIIIGMDTITVVQRGGRL